MSNKTINNSADVYHDATDRETRSRVDCFGNEQSARRVCFCPSRRRRNANLAARKWGAKSGARTIQATPSPPHTHTHHHRVVQHYLHIMYIYYYIRHELIIIYYWAGWRAPQLENINTVLLLLLLNIIILLGPTAAAVWSCCNADVCISCRSCASNYHPKYSDRLIYCEPSDDVLYTQWWVEIGII